MYIVLKQLKAIPSANAAGNNNTGNQGDAKPSDKINGKGNGSVKTGDTNAVMPWMILLFVSGAGIIGAAEVSRKKQNK